MPRDLDSILYGNYDYYCVSFYRSWHTSSLCELTSGKHRRIFNISEWMVYIRARFRLLGGFAYYTILRDIISKTADDHFKRSSEDNPRFTSQHGFQLFAASTRASTPTNYNQSIETTSIFAREVDLDTRSVQLQHRRACPHITSQTSPSRNPAQDLNIQERYSESQSYPSDDNELHAT